MCVAGTEHGAIDDLFQVLYIVVRRVNVEHLKVDLANVCELLDDTPTLVIIIASLVIEAHPRFFS